MTGLDRSVVVSVDVEPDVAMFAEGDFGLTEGLPKLVNLFRRMDIPVDYFFTLDAARAVPDFARDQATDNGWLGCHGLLHRPPYYSRRSSGWQRQTVTDATEGLKEITGVSPKMFRAPNFSVSAPILETLEALGYAADSSVLPGRYKRVFRILPLTDHRNAPRFPYHPHASDPCKEGPLNLWEFPITENPLSPGAPIGLGFVNASTSEAALRAVRLSSGPAITVLCHPWEAVDLREKYSGLPGWLTSTCRDDLRSFEAFLKGLLDEFSFVRLRDLVGDGPSRDSHSGAS